MERSGACAASVALHDGRTSVAAQASSWLERLELLTYLQVMPRSPHLLTNNSVVYMKCFSE